MREHPINEGAAFADMPRVFGYGDVMSLPAIRERYITLRLFGWRLFVARGNYGSYGRCYAARTKRRTRWHLLRDRS